jgi:hypothetical protein
MFHIHPPAQGSLSLPSYAEPLPSLRLMTGTTLEIKQYEYEVNIIFIQPALSLALI